MVDNYTDGVVARFAENYGFTRSQITQYLSDTYRDGKSIGDGAARKIEQRLSLQHLWLDGEQNSPVVTLANNVQWPFAISFDAFAELSEQDKKEIETLLRLKVEYRRRNKQRSS